VSTFRYSDYAIISSEVNEGESGTNDSETGLNCGKW
jgi:hypothetical protein